MKARKDHCKLWTWKRSTACGYGVIVVKGRQHLVHRVMWQGLNGPIPPGMLVMHKCDTPACFNPNHLTLGTYLDNNRDRATKGRSAIGEKSGRAKLRVEQVEDIRNRYRDGTTQTALSKEYGISTHQASMIVRNLSWRHL